MVGVKRFSAVVLLVGGLLAAGGAFAATVYNEAFTGVANGTNLNGIQPATGQPWSVTVGTQTVSGNAITPTAAAMTAYGVFTNALSSGTLTLSANFSAKTCNASGNNTGVSLFVGASEKIFVGCSGTVNTTLAVGLNGGAATTVVPGTTGTVTITYTYSTGA